MNRAYRTFNSNKETYNNQTILEMLDATYNGNETYDVHVWNFDTNRCEHATITRIAGATIAIPMNIIEAWNQEQHQTRTSGWCRI